MNETTIILIGPTGVGKSTIGKLVAERLGRKSVSADDTRHTYLEETPFDKTFSDDLKKISFEAVIKYWENFNAHVVLMTLKEHVGCVIDFGAIHSVYDDPLELQKIYHAVRQCFCVLLLPCPDSDQALKILIERGRDEGMPDSVVSMWRRIIGRFIMHPSNRLLANSTIYTVQKTEEEVANEVIASFREWCATRNLGAEMRELK